MISVSIYEQEFFFSPGKRHYRVTRDDGQLIFERHHVDFYSLEDAKAAIEGDFRRNNRGAVIVRVFGIGDNKNPIEEVKYEYMPQATV